MKMLGKSEFLFALELASSTIGLHIGSKSCFGAFSKFLNLKMQTSRLHQEVYEMWLVVARCHGNGSCFSSSFFLVCGLVCPLKRYFSKCSILALEKRYLGKD